MNIGGQSDTKSERKVYRLTPAFYAKTRERLDYLRNVKRREIADYIHEAKEAGDISESSAYEEAKNEQAKLEGQIIELEQLLALSEIMTPDMHKFDGPLTVRIGTEIELENEDGKKRVYRLVETFEADPKAGFISDQSPVGKALLDHKEGDEVHVSTPGGVTSYSILSIRPMF
jgi:transcription elongation factor GreA